MESRERLECRATRPLPATSTPPTAGGASQAVDCVSTAGGPSSEATVASSGSAALWQEHNREGALGLAGLLPGASDTPRRLRGDTHTTLSRRARGPSSDSVVGTDTSRHRWTASPCGCHPCGPCPQPLHDRHVTTMPVGAGIGVASGPCVASFPSLVTAACLFAQRPVARADTPADLRALAPAIEKNLTTAILGFWYPKVHRSRSTAATCVDFDAAGPLQGPGAQDDRHAGADAVAFLAPPPRRAWRLRDA